MEPSTSKQAEAEADTLSLSRPPTYSSQLSAAPSYASQSYPTPTYTSSSPPSPTAFTTLLATNSQLVNIVLSASSPSTSNATEPLFYVTNSQWSPNKPSVTLHRGSKTGPILGHLNLSWGSANAYGLGDHEGENGGEGNVMWGELRRTSKWTHGTYEFKYLGRTFVWQRTRQPVFADQPDLELREAGGGEVLAVYVGCQGWGRKRGRFYLRKGGLGGDSVGEKTEENAEEWGDWEAAVLLTACGVIEGARRRARQRRAGGGGG